MIDSARLSDWLRANAPQLADVGSIERFSGGQSNPTFLLTTPGGRFVLRRKPPGTILKGAHAIEREARVQAALHDAGFPVPGIVARCDDPAVIGAPFYIMHHVDGRMFWRSDFSEAPAGERAGLFDAMNATIARLHGLDPVALGLSDYGRVENYLARQIARWSAQYRADEEAGRIAELDALAEWLPGVVPASGGVAVVHGDFRVDNLIFARDREAVLAVIDWELSTLGDPLADFAYHLMMYRLPPSFPGGLLGVDLSVGGLPDEADYVRRYCDRTGRAGIADLDIYLCYNLFRFAAIVHGIKGRMLRGNAASADAGKLVAELPVIARIAHDLARKAGMPA